MVRTARRRKKSNRDYVPLNSDSNIIQLMQFMKQNGWENSTNLSVAEFPTSGRGLYSVSKIDKDKHLINIPKQLLMNLNSIESDDEFVAKYDENVGNQTPKEITFQCLLSLYLCYQKLLKEKSTWNPYIQTLPSSFFNPYFCTKSELHFLDETLLQKIVQQHETLKKGFEIAQQFDSSIDLELYKWTYFVVNTRGVFIDPNLAKIKYFKDQFIDSPNIALAPLLDFFNHSDSSESIAKATPQSYTLVTKMPFNRYEQLTINYGSHNNQKLLLEYGFFISNNKHNYLVVTLDDINRLIKVDPELRTIQIARPKFQFIKEHSLGEQMFFDVTDGLSHNLAVILMMVFIEKNVHNLKQIAFGDDLNLELVRPYGMKLLEMKEIEYKKLVTGLNGLKNRSDSGTMCLKYYEECIVYLNKCKNSIK